MEKMKYDIEGLGRFVIFKGQQIRTPCSIETSNENEVVLLEFYLHTNSMNYQKHPVQKPEQKQNTRTIKEPKKIQKKPVQKIKKDRKSMSILEKLVVDEKIEGFNNEKN